jgi:predicted nucleotidyltransferase
MVADVSQVCAEDVLATLRAHEAELRAAGIRRLSLFGSVARGEAGPDSDVDLVVELDRDAHIDLFRLTGLEQRIAEGSPNGSDGRLICCRSLWRSGGFRRISTGTG